jgi:predicted small lipoprotein YifL
MQNFKRILLTICLVLTLSSCGWDGNFRYPCQDPANWETAECVPPICEASETCTKDLIDAPVSTTTP